MLFESQKGSMSLKKDKKWLLEHRLEALVWNFTHFLNKKEMIIAACPLLFNWNWPYTIFSETIITCSLILKIDYFIIDLCLLKCCCCWHSWALWSADDMSKLVFDSLGYPATYFWSIKLYSGGKKLCCNNNSNTCSKVGVHRSNYFKKKMIDPSYKLLEACRYCCCYWIHWN